MKKVIFLFFTLYSVLGFSQNEYVNEDGTVSNYALRELAVAALNSQSSGEAQYDIDDKNLIVITKNDCGDKKWEKEEMQKRAMHSSFEQLLNSISSFKRVGYNMLTDIEFKGMIFKTNTICMSSTRRYHFKFDFEELNSFPEYMDLEELFQYVVIKNDNRNIIHVKNN